MLPRFGAVINKDTMDINTWGFVNIGFVSPEEKSRSTHSIALSLGPGSFFLPQNAETAMQRLMTLQSVESDH